MLIEHGINDMRKGLIGRKESMAPRQEVTFKHSLHGVLAEHFYHPAVAREFGAVSVLWKILSNPELLTHLVNCVELIGCVLVRTEDAEVLHVELHNFPQKIAQRTSVFG